MILDRNWSTVEETAAALLEQETLSGVALDAVLSTVQEVSLEELRGVRRAAPPRFTTRDPQTRARAVRRAAAPALAGDGHRADRARASRPPGSPTPPATR